MPSASTARNASSSLSRSSMLSPEGFRTSTFSARACISFTSTLKDSGMPGSGTLSPLTMAS